MIELNRLTRGLRPQKVLFPPIVYCRVQIRKASHQIEIHCFLKPSVLMENFAKTHRRFVVPDIPLFSPTETVLSIKEKYKFNFIESPILILCWPNEYSLLSLFSLLLGPPCLLKG